MPRTILALAALASLATACAPANAAPPSPQSTAAVAAKSGMQVTLVEASERILQRVAAPETSDYFRALHQSKGVTIHENTGLDRLTGDTTVTGAILSDGTELSADVVIVGIGILPNTDLAEAAGITLELGGIKTDIQGRTNDPAIFAAGDCACLPYKGSHIRLESVQNAIDQAEAVAENMLGASKDYEPKPWFWSDQYDTKLQIAGLNIGYDRIVTRDNGVKPLLWVGQRSLNTRELDAQPHLRPVLLRREFFGFDRDLIVSPQHGVLLRTNVRGGDEILYRAIHLARLPGGAVRQMLGCRAVTYMHLLFDQHEVIFANGAPSESLSPGQTALGSMGAAARDEVFELFGDLADLPTGVAYGAPARDYSRTSKLPDHLSFLRQAG